MRRASARAREWLSRTPGRDHYAAAEDRWNWRTSLRTQLEVTMRVIPLNR
ncbi:MAG TPA: hypothetical protein VHQ44_02735 [Thermoanaerobaculia bacterium]|nr:hypothetical protein [Thermoanaerobaculia bacterium]